MNSIVSKEDFPSKDSFVYLNAANVGLMYSEAEKVIKPAVNYLIKKRFCLLMICF